MEEKLYLISLFDCYGALLTEKQKCYFTCYYLEDLSLSEIGENFSISKNAVSKQLKEITFKLNDYEKKLHFLSKKKKFHDIIEKIEDKKIKEALENL